MEVEIKDGLLYLTRKKKRQKPTDPLLRVSAEFDFERRQEIPP